MPNKGSYAIAGTVGSLASRRFLIGRTDRKRIIFDAATAYSLKRWAKYKIDHDKANYRQFK